VSERRLGSFRYWLSHGFCKFLCAVLFRPRVFGRENVPADGPVLLLSNHQSFLDPVLCGINLKRHVTFVARDTLTNSRLYKWLTGSFEIIHIKRGEADLSAMKMIIERLKAGRVVLIFPEATRTRDGRISDIKAGFGLLSRRSKAAVVPIVVDGAFECWPRHKKFFSPGRISVSYGELITSEQIQEWGDEKFAELLTEKLRKMQNELRADSGRKTYDY